MNHESFIALRRSNLQCRSMHLNVNKQVEGDTGRRIAAWHVLPWFFKHSSQGRTFEECRASDMGRESSIRQQNELEKDIWGTRLDDMEGGARNPFRARARHISNPHPSRPLSSWP